MVQAVSREVAACMTCGDNFCVFVLWSSCGNCTRSTEPTVSQYYIICNIIIIIYICFYLILFIMYSYCYVCSILGTVFHCIVLCIVCVSMCTVLLPLGVNQIAVNEYIVS